MRLYHCTQDTETSQRLILFIQDASEKADYQILHLFGPIEVFDDIVVSTINGIFFSSPVLNFLPEAVGSGTTSVCAPLGLCSQNVVSTINAICMLPGPYFTT